MAHYLVTGGCGFIGSHLVDLLVDGGHKVTVLDDMSTGNAQNITHKDVRIIHDCIADSSAVAHAFAGVDGCFHLAAVASVQKSVDDPVSTSHINAGGTLQILNAAVQAGNVPVVYASSAAVYGDTQAESLHEDLKPAPLSIYGTDKTTNELHARALGKTRGLPSFGLRFFNVFGPRQDPASPYSGVISIFAARALKGEPLVIFGNGEQTRDFVYVGDVVAAILRAMDKAATTAPVGNVCTGKAVSVAELGKQINTLAGNHTEIEFKPARTGDIFSSVGDTNRLQNRLGYTCTTPLSIGLTRTLDWMKASQQSK